MSKVISIHEYILKSDADEEQFGQAIHNSKEKVVILIGML